MKTAAVLITKPAVDFSTFLKLAEEALGYSPSEVCDKARRPLSESERFLSCLSALKDRNSEAGLSPNLLHHVSFSALIACDERDLIEVMEVASGIHFTTADSLFRGLMIAVASGSLGQWKQAVVAGLRLGGSIHALYGSIMTQFEGCGLNVWGDYERKRDRDNQLYLEDRR